MKTERLYRQDVYMKETEARVLQIAETKKGTEVVFDRTVFFPEGGGQPSDKGVVIYTPDEYAAPRGRAYPFRRLRRYIRRSEQGLPHGRGLYNYRYPSSGPL